MDFECDCGAAMVIECAIGWMRSAVELIYELVFLAEEVSLEEVFFRVILEWRLLVDIKATDSNRKLTLVLQRPHRMRHRHLWSWQIQKYSISFTIQLICETRLANISMINRDVLVDSVAFELLSRLIATNFVEIKGVQMAEGLHSSNEGMREGSTASA